MKKKWKCVFCKRWDKDVWKIVVSPDAGICNSCISIASQAILDTPKNEANCVIAIYINVDNTPEGIAKFFETHND